MKKIFLIIFLIISVEYSYSQLPPPVPIYPSGDSCVNYQNVHFNWHHINGAASYRIHVSSGPNVILDVSGIADTFYIPTVGVFTMNTFYYWRLKAYGLVGESPWTTYYHFVTCPAVPVPPTLLAPPDSAIDVSLHPTLDWSDVSGAIYYRLQISTDSLFSNTILNITGLSNSSYTMTTALAYCTRYYWRVCAIGPSGQGQWSVVWTFKTICQIGINPISSEIPAENKLFNNYPNPFNPITKIRFQIKDSRTVTLKVFDILGKEVKALVNEILSLGIYEVSFDGGNLSGGVYFYVIRTDGFTDTKRMLLIK